MASDASASDNDHGHGRRCDHCLEHKDKTRVEDSGSVICSDCDDERHQDTDDQQTEASS